MKIAEHTEKLIDEVNNFSESQILNKYEVSVITEASLFSAKEKLFNDIIFQAKYIKGLLHIVSSQAVNKDEYMEKIFGEFNKAVERFMKLLEECMDGMSEKVREHFRKRFFDLTHEGMAELLKLAADLALIKEYYNSRK